MPQLPERMRELQTVRLGQGEVVVTRAPLVVQTTLGSCVSVILHDPPTGFSAVCHAVMPTANDPADRSLRYVDQAVEHLLRKLAVDGVPLRRLSAKVIGGAVGSWRAGGSPAIVAIGPRNVEMALACLEREGLAVVARDTGGEVGRRVLLETATGDVYVRSLGCHRAEVL